MNENEPNQVVSPHPMCEPRKPPNEYQFNTPQFSTLIHPTQKAAIIPPAIKWMISYIKQEEFQNNIKKLIKSANHRPVDDTNK